MTRNEILAYSKQIGIKPKTHNEECIIIDTIQAIRETEKCVNCMRRLKGCSIYESIDPFAIDPVIDFGCTDFTPCK